MKEKKKGKGCITVLLVVVIVFVALVIIGTIVGDDDGNSGNTGNASSTSSTASEKTELSDNILMNAKEQTADVMNGTKDKTIGTRAFIEVSKTDLKNISKDDYAEFCKKRVDKADYNWYTIACDDGTGILFYGCNTFSADYGKLDADGSISDIYGSITKKKKGGYKYKKAPTAYEAGTYKIGTDLKAREYLLVPNDFSTAYFEVDKDSTGTIDSIITNDNFEGTRYITVKDGQYLKLRDCKAYAAKYVKSGEIDNTLYSNGMYKVGVDLKAGEYKLKCNNGVNGYYEVDSDSTGDMYSIISNDNFDTDTYVTVSDGQYLKLSGCDIIITLKK